jgi:hypothetical protein
MRFAVQPQTVRNFVLERGAVFDQPQPEKAAA